MTRLIVLVVLAGCCTAIAAQEKPTYTLRPLPYKPFALTPNQVFEKVKDSVVVVKTLHASGKIIRQGSGVLLPSGKIGTNCHVLKTGVRFQVGGGNHFVYATLWGSDEDKDICLLEAKRLSAKPAQLGQATRLKVGESVYAVGAPQGLELSLSNGIVSQLRGGPPPFIQTTAAISPGSSGGGLFDEQGQLVGFTTLYIEGAQSLNFAMPVEWAEQIQPGTKAAQGRSEGDWNKRASALQSASNWTALRDWCQEWTRVRPGSFVAWDNLGYAYRWLKRPTDAIDAYHQSLRVNPTNADVWYNLGGTYVTLARYADAIEAYRQVVRINPEHEDAWNDLAIIYDRVGNRTAALEAIGQLRRINPDKAAGCCLSYTDKSGVTYTPMTTGDLLFSR